MTQKQANKLPFGAYRIFWKTGGSSVASVGSVGNPKGDRWFAPVNRVGFKTAADGSLISNWESVAHVVLIENAYSETEPIGKDTCYETLNYRVKVDRNWVESVAPEHGRTSCNDTNLCNSHYEIHETKVNDVVVRRSLDLPRCYRCFLLVVLKDGLDPRIQLGVEVTLKARTPKFKIEQL
jgi:hypothetical protein